MMSDFVCPGCGCTHGYGECRSAGTQGVCLCGAYKRGEDGCCVSCLAAWDTRDYSALYKDGRCVLCGNESTIYHAAKHLSTGEACMQLDYAAESPVWTLYLTRDVPLTDTQGISVLEHDGDKWDRTDPNAEHLRAAIVKAGVLNRETARKIRAARKAAGK